MPENIRLSVIIPAYNEEERIGPTLESLDRYLKVKDYNSEIIVVANNCTDRTDDIVKEYQEKIPYLVFLDIDECNGKGCAVKVGMEKAKGEFKLFMDADNATKITEMDHFWPYFEKGYDVVIGSRDIKGAKVAIPQTWYKELAGKIGNVLIQIVAVPGIHDTQCGFKVFSRKSADRIFPLQKLGGFGFDIEILALARKFGFKIKEEPITWHNAEGSKVSLKSYFNVFKDLFKVRWWLWTGKYKK